ncbi:MAG: PAS domain S-box protein [Anaerolineales bacterium]|nr:PAS domain S-box protein [Anaerolineales bacterium]
MLGLIVIDEHHRISECNNDARKMLSIEDEHLIGKSMTDLWPEWSHAKARLLKGEVLEWDFPLHADENVAHFHVYGLSHNDDETLRLTLAFQEISGWQEERILSRRHEIMLKAVCRSIGQFVSDENPHLLFEDLLSDLLELTQSEYGFIGRVLKTEDGNSYLKTYAITNIAWNEDTRALYEANVLKGMEFYNLDTLFGACITTKEPVIANDAKNDPRSGGTPAGHPPLKSFLGVPFLQDEELIGMGGIANRPAGYDEQIIQDLQPFFQTCSNLISAYAQFELRQQVEIELRDVNEMLSAFLEAASEGIGFVDPEGTILRVNQRIEELFGYERSELIGQSVECLIPERFQKHHVDHRADYINKPFTRPMGSGLEIYARRKDGTEFPIDVSLSYIERDDGIHSMFFITDITRRKKYEQELEEARDLLEIRVKERTQELADINEALRAEIISRERAERADLLKTRFVSDVTHELRTPLSIITLTSGNLDLLYNQLDDAKRQGMVQEIRAHAQIMNDLIGDVLEISRLDDGIVSADREWTDLVEITTKVIAEQTPLATKKQQTLDLSGTGTLPVFADSEQISRVIRNLVNNAIKYTPDGGTINCTCVKVSTYGGSDRNWPGIGELPEGAWAALCVQDNGVGIHEQDLERVFERFYRVEAQSNIPGTGLGLAIAQELMECNRGYIYASSTPGIGSMFALYLPPIED